jgi:Zn-dependent protease
MDSLDINFIIFSFVIFIYSTVCHEAAHAWAALKMGDRTAYEGGQVSLDPVPHIRREPFGMIIVPLISLFLNGGILGWASAPYDPHWALRYPRRSALMALAGPAANLLICILAVILMFIAVKSGVMQIPGMSYRNQILVGEGMWNQSAQFLSILFSLNLLLFVFNLLPVPPLDGSNIPLLWLRGSSAARYQEFMAQPGVQILTFVLIWRGVGFIYVPVWNHAVGWILKALN